MTALFTSNHLALEEIFYQDIADEIAAVNPELANIINKLKPSKDLTLFKVTYHYGDKILHRGECNIPLKQGGTISISSHEIPPDIKERLEYNPLPVSLILKNNCEVYSDSKNHFTPYRVYQPGEMFGTWELFEPQQFKAQSCNWDISAGVRSVIMLPKITINSAHSRLRTRYEFDLPPPKYAAEQHAIFSKLAQHHLFPEKWHCTVIFFPKEWLEQATEFVHIWTLFSHYLLRESWNQTLYLRNQLSIAVVWQTLAAEMVDMSNKPRNYLVETIKKLIMIGLGTEPAFVPATDSKSLPLQGLQDVYVKNYRLKHIPTIMETTKYLTPTSDLSVYYSLQHPILLHYPPEYDNSRSAMQDLETIKHLIDALLEKLKKEKPKEYSLIKHLHFDYYHTEKDCFRVMHLASELPKDDARFLFNATINKNLKFANTASFLRGCIKISIKQ